MTDIIRNIERVAPEVVAAAAQYPSSILADVAGRRGGLHGALHRFHPAWPLQALPSP